MINIFKKVEIPKPKIVFEKILRNDDYRLIASVNELNEASIEVSSVTFVSGGKYINRIYVKNSILEYYINRIYVKNSILECNWHGNEISQFEDEVDAIWKKYNG